MCVVVGSENDLTLRWKIHPNYNWKSEIDEICLCFIYLQIPCLLSEQISEVLCLSGSAVDIILPSNFRASCVAHLMNPGNARTS